MGMTVNIVKSEISLQQREQIQKQKVVRWSRQRQIRVITRKREERRTATK
jgi:hypothetical protein